MPLDPHRLLVLRAVRRTGSIHAAAAALHLAPSGVSQHLTRLEAETGLRLIDRTRRGAGRPVQLTTTGMALAEHADAVATALGEAQREADRLREGSTGTVRIGGFATALRQLVVPVLRQLSISEPGLQTQIVEVDDPEGLRQLRAGELDLLLIEQSPQVCAPAGFIDELLCRDHYRIVVPTTWPSTRTLDELLSGPWVVYPPGHQPRRMLDQLRTRHHTDDAGDQHVCTESRTMLTLVAAGLGAALVPDLTLDTITISGIRVHDTDTDIGSRVLSVLGPDHDHASPPTNRFRTLLHQIATGNVSHRPD
jgi:DNA-binding transcriptional LysR family regulator